MAATTPSDRPTSEEDAGVGLAHLTVVPSNFEPEPADR